MKSVVRKLFMDFEKEEKWLNDMSSKGLQFVDYSIGRYVFEHGQKGEYIYRIELLEDIPSHPESKAYIDFMEESGVEHVGSYFRWVYFRKKAKDGASDLYTDYESKIKHFKKIKTLLATCLIINFLAASINLFYGFFGDVLELVDHYYNMERPIFYPGIVTGLVSLVFVAVLIPIVRKYGIKVRSLKKEKNIYE